MFRRFGCSNIQVSAMGLGCWWMEFGLLNNEQMKKIDDTLERASVMS